MKNERSSIRGKKQYSGKKAGVLRDKSEVSDGEMWYTSVLILFVIGRNRAMCYNNFRNYSGNIGMPKPVADLYDTSTVTDAEFLVKPFEDKNEEQVEKYHAYIKSLDFLKCFINEQVGERAARIRAKYHDIKLGDALQ